MARIILTEGQLTRLKAHLNETIDPSEAYRDEASVDTILNGKRNVGFLAAYYTKAQDLISKAKEGGLKIISMPQDSHAHSTANIIYREGFEDEAMRLAEIARKNGGYLPINTPEETYEIGILLGYHPEKVKEFVLEKFPNYKFY